jgi:Uma2 family endonuclease
MVSAKAPNDEWGYGVLRCRQVEIVRNSWICFVEQPPFVLTPGRETVSTFVVDSATVRVPTWVESHADFRRWYHSADFPESGRICYLNGETWVDMSKEQVFTHNQVKGEFNRVLQELSRSEPGGLYFPDGILLSNAGVGFSSQPDGAFATHEAFRANRVQLVEGATEGYVELEGTVDIVLEVVSRSSVHKDTVELRELYWQAGIREYWLVDARGDNPLFDVLKHAAKGYVATRKQNGWLKSVVFGKAFHLSRQKDPLGYPQFTLETR